MEKVVHEAKVAAAVSTEGSGGIVVGFEIEHDFRGFPTGRGIRHTPGESAVFEGALDLAAGSDQVDGSGGFGASSDHMEGCGGAVFELDEDGLMIHDIGPAFPDASAIGIILSERTFFIGERGVGDSFQRIPHIEGPPVGVVEIVFSGGVEAVGLYWAVGQASRTGSWRRFPRGKLKVAAERGDADGGNAALHPGDQIEVVAAFREEH